MIHRALRFSVFSSLLAVSISACGGPGGECNTRADCSAGEICIDSMCVAGGGDGGLCGSGETECVGGCVDTRFDSTHCGVCGNTCGATERCFLGVCESVCGVGDLACGGTCVDPRSDPANCGGCGNACAAGEVCFLGACGRGCPEGETLCPGDGCVDVRSDAGNCGGCGVACGADKVCEAGACVLTPFGDGTEGARTIDADVLINEERALLSAAAAAGATTIVIDDTTSSFANDQMVLIHQTQSASGNAGHWEIARLTNVAPLAGSTTATLTLAAPLKNDYTADPAAFEITQVVAIPEYTRLELTAGTLTAPAWDGSTGGILAIAAQEEIVVNYGASIDMSERGFRSFAGVNTDNVRHQGEGEPGPGGNSHTLNGLGGGGGGVTCGTSVYRASGGAGGGGNGSAGGAGGATSASCVSDGGAGGRNVMGLSDPSRIFLGGAGGTSTGYYTTATIQIAGKRGGEGGGLIYLSAPRIIVDGTLLSNGALGRAGSCYVLDSFITYTHCTGGSGGGAGGSVYLRTGAALIGSGVSAVGGFGGAAQSGSIPAGGDGGVGRIFIHGPADVFGVPDPFFYYYVP